MILNRPKEIPPEIDIDLPDDFEFEDDLNDLDFFNEGNDYGND